MFEKQALIGVIASPVVIVLCDNLISNADIEMFFSYFPMRTSLYLLELQSWRNKKKKKWSKSI